MENSNGQQTSSDDEFDRHIQIWSKVIDTQMHFNEMCVKSRQLGLAFATAALGFGIVFLNQDGSFIITVASFDIHLAVPLILSVALAVYAVMQLDLHVYHKMLRGAVSFNEDFEERHLRKKLGMDKGLTQAVSHFGRHKDAKFDLEGKSGNYKGTITTNSEKRIKRFYHCTIGVLCIISLLILFYYNLITLQVFLHKNPQSLEWMVAFGWGAFMIFILRKILSTVRERNSPNEEQRS